MTKFINCGWLDQLIVDFKLLFHQYSVDIALEFSRTAHRLFRFYCEETENIHSQIQWNWACFYTLLKHPDEETRWHTAKTLILLGNHNQFVTEEILEGICSSANDQKYLK